MNLAFRLAIVFGVLLGGQLIWELCRQFSTGKLMARGFRLFSGRQENPMLYWSSMILQILVAVMVIGTIILGILGARK